MMRRFAPAAIVRASCPWTCPAVTTTGTAGRAPLFQALRQARWLSTGKPSDGKPPDDKPFVVKSDVVRVRVSWTPEEDILLADGVKKYGRSWTKISEALLPHRKHAICCVRWTHSLDPKIKNGFWTPAEDARLKKLVRDIGEKWAEIAEHMDGRTQWTCRQRWTENIDPSLKHGPWSDEEDAVLLEEYALHPNKWVTIKASLPGRSTGDIGVRYRALTKLEHDRVSWKTNEDDLLTAAVDKHSTRDWNKIAQDVPGRTRVQCMNRWNLRMAHQGKTKAAWSKEDDALLEKRVEELGTDGKWAAIAAGIPGKSGRECKTRWERELLRDMNTDPWSPEEDATIKRLRKEGKYWNMIFHQLPGRDKDAIMRRCEELGCGIVGSDQGRE